MPSHFPENPIETRPRSGSLNLEKTSRLRKRGGTAATPSAKARVAPRPPMLHLRLARHPPIILKKVPPARRTRGTNAACRDGDAPPRCARPSKMIAKLVVRDGCSLAKHHPGWGNTVSASRTRARRAHATPSERSTNTIQCRSWPPATQRHPRIRHSRKAALNRARNIWKTGPAQCRCRPSP